MEFCASLSISASVSVAGVNQALSLDMQRQSGRISGYVLSLEYDRNCLL